MGKKESNQGITVELRDASFPMSIWCNQFSAKDQDGGKLVHFGFHTEQGLASLFSVFLEPDCIENSKIGTLGFLDKIGGTPTTSAPEWRGLIEPRNTPAANMILMVAAGSIVEIRLGIFAHGDAVAKVRAKKGETIFGSPVALLHCNKDLIRHFITAIYI